MVANMFSADRVSHLTWKYGNEVVSLINCDIFISVLTLVIYFFMMIHKAANRNTEILLGAVAILTDLISHGLFEWIKIAYSLLLSG